VESDTASPLPETRLRKFRQAAFVYLHVGILYEFAAFAMWREGILPVDRGPVVLWLVLGAAITLLVSWALWHWPRPWLARAVWAVHGLRIPALVSGAFFHDPALAAPASFYLTALVVVVGNMWMLARAGWDL
jgi:hypothetical protein